MKFKGFLESCPGMILDPEIMVEVNMTHYNSLDIPKYIKKYNGYLFYVDDIEFLFKGNHTGQNEWIIKFGVHKGNGKLDIEMSGKHEIKNTILILNYVAKCLSMFTKQYKPNQITFIADRKSRQLTYERLIVSLYKEPEFQCYSFPDKKYSQNYQSVIYIMKRS